LWELGIRKITPVHAVNNAVGGPAIFTAQYAANNHLLNGTPVDGEPSFFDLPAVRFVIDRSPWLPVDVVLGEFAVFRDVGGDGVQGWNPQGWFDFSTGPAAGADQIVGADSARTGRLGQDKPQKRTRRGGAGGR